MGNKKIAVIVGSLRKELWNRKIAKELIANRLISVFCTINHL